MANTTSMTISELREFAKENKWRLLYSSESDEGYVLPDGDTFLVTVDKSGDIIEIEDPGFEPIAVKDTEKVELVKESSSWYPIDILGVILLVVVILAMVIAITYNTAWHKGYDYGSGAWYGRFGQSYNHTQQTPGYNDLW